MKGIAVVTEWTCGHAFLLSQFTQTRVARVSMSKKILKARTAPGPVFPLADDVCWLKNTFPPIEDIICIAKVPPTPFFPFLV